MPVQVWEKMNCLHRAQIDQGHYVPRAPNELPATQAVFHTLSLSLSVSLFPSLYPFSFISSNPLPPVLGPCPRFISSVDPVRWWNNLSFNLIDHFIESYSSLAYGANMLSTRAQSRSATMCALLATMRQSILIHLQRSS